MKVLKNVSGCLCVCIFMTRRKMLPTLMFLSLRVISNAHYAWSEGIMLKKRDHDILHGVSLSIIECNLNCWLPMRNSSCPLLRKARLWAQPLTWARCKNVNSAVYGFSFICSKNTFENYYFSIFIITKHSIKFKTASACPLQSNMCLPCFHSCWYIWEKYHQIISSNRLKQNADTYTTMTNLKE